MPSALPARRSVLLLLAPAAVAAAAAIPALDVLARHVAPARAPAEAPLAVSPVPVPPALVPPPARFSVLTLRLGRNEALGQALGRMGIAPGQAQAILHALGDDFPFRRIQPGDQLRLERAEGASLSRFSYRQSASQEWTVAPAADGALHAEKRAVAVTTEVARVDVEIRGSLWESLQRAGEDPALAVEVADALAWDVDFYQDVRAGDHLKVLVEKVSADGRLLRYGAVLAAEYEGATTGRKRLFRYTDPDGRTSYYDDAGNSARRGFLKSPLKYAHLTSRFGTRLHPVLGYVRAHQGVDYGAPTGTPVWAVGDAIVAQAGWSGGCGKAVVLRHRNGLETVYCHLSTVSVRPGARVAQKQVIGLVGQTGLATGPHLHFAVKRSGSFVNPMTLKLPPAAPVAAQHRSDFAVKVERLRTRLDRSPVA